MDNTNADLGDRVTALETASADHEKRIASLESSVSDLASKVAALPVGLTQDDINNATHPLADDLAALRSTVADISAQLSALPPETVAVLNNDSDARNAWVDNVLNKFFPGEKPVAVDDTGRTG